MTERGGWGLPLAAVGLTLALHGCGKDSCPEGQTGAPPNCMVIVTKTPCTQSPVTSYSGPVGSRILLYSDFPLTESGRLDLTLDWTNASSPVGIYVVPANTCTLDEFNKRTCTFLVRSEPPGSKPRKISTPNFQAGNYRFLIANGSEASESVSLQVSLSKGDNCPSLTDGRPSVSSRRDATGLRMDRAARF